MQKALVITIIVFTLVLVYFGHTFLQQKIQPKQSAQRLLLYIVSCLVLVLALTFAMTLLVGVLFPKEIRK